MKNILVVSLTNIGDVILTLPVVDSVRHQYPQASLTLIGGPGAASLFRDNPFIRYVVYNKRAAFSEKVSWIKDLRRQPYDLVVDLRNSAIPFLVRTRQRTPLHWKRFTGVHIKQTHLMRLQTIWKHPLPAHPAKTLWVPPADREHIRRLIQTSIGAGGYVALCPGAADPYKRWPARAFAQLADRIIEQKKMSVVLVGSLSEASLMKEIISSMNNASRVVNLAGQTDLLQAAQVFLDSRLVVANDSGPMHYASYLDVPTIGIFGYSDPAYASPWGRNGIAIRRNQDCPACWADAERLSSARDKRHIAKDGRDHTCLSAVSVEDVWKVVSECLP